MLQDFFIIMFFLSFIGGAILRNNKWVSTHLPRFQWRRRKYEPKDKE